MPQFHRIAALWLLFWLAPLLPGRARAGDEDAANQYYVVKVWGVDDGLTEGSVTDVAQTPEGYLWVGTVFGSVLRFDGTRFVSYNSANTPEFSLKWGVPRLMVDQAGVLWISMHDGGLTTWDQQGFHAALTSTNQPGQLLWSAPGRVIFNFAHGQLLSGRRQGEQWEWRTVILPRFYSPDQLCADAFGRVWYLQDRHTVAVWDGRETKILKLTSALAAQPIKVLMADALGDIWIGTDRTLAKWEQNHFVAHPPLNGEPVLNVQRVVASGAGTLWVEANGRMRRCAGGRWQAEASDWRRELGGFESLRFLHGDDKGGLWTSAGDLGLVHVLADGTTHRLTTREGLPSNTVHFAYQDRDGNTWLGYERGGLVQVRPRLFHVIGTEEGLNENLVNTVCEDVQGTVWIGTHGGAIGRCVDGVCTNLTLPAMAAAEDSVISADNKGRVWIGAQGTGLLLCEGGQVRQLVTADQLDSYPRLMLPARDGRLWVGTLFSISTVRDGRLTLVYTAKTVGGHPTGLAEAADGTIWAGTLDGLLLRWNGRQFEPVIPPQRSSLGRIWALWPTPDGGLWAGTEQGGLLHWKDGRFHRFTIKNGLPSDCVIQVLGDAQGNLWLGTRAGIVRIFGAAIARCERGDLTVLPVSRYARSDGLLTIGSAIISQPNCWRGADGNLFFAMANSVASIRPEAVHINPLPPTVVLEELQAEDARVWPQRAGAIQTAAEPADPQTPESILPEVSLAPGHGDLDFRYTGLSLGSPLGVRFRYKLDGLEKNWNEAHGERRAIYRHVPPGKYVFRVLAGNSDSVWNEGGELLKVNIAPYFYQTAWFQGSAGLLTVAALSFGVVITMRRRMSRHLAQVKHQHALERERTRIAQDLHDDLGAGLTEISLLGGLLQDPSRYSARKQEALERIVQRCRSLVMALDEIVWAVNPRNDSVNSLSGYLSRYAQGFLEPTAIRCRLHVREAAPDLPLTSEQRHNLFLAFKEALTNVVRHSAATEVNMFISVEAGNLLSIRLEDNGRGLPDVVEQDANGLVNLRQRLAHIGGQCVIARGPAGGLAVHLQLPL